MPRFDFQSTGGNAVGALYNFLQQAALRRAQEQEIRLREREASSNEQIRQAQLAEQQRQAQRQARQDEIAEADRLARIHAPDRDLSADVAGTMRKGGYNVTTRTTLPARTIDMPASSVPGVMTGSTQPMVPGVVMPSNTYHRRAETFEERLAREQREAAAAERDEEREFRWNTAREAERARASQAGDANAVRLEIAQANAIQRAEAATARLEQARTTADINRARLELQQALADLKIDDAHRERRQGESAIATGRSEIRELAQSLIDDPALDSITGPIEGRRETFYQGSNVEALRRLNQLVNKLSLEGRGKLKGQGAVSDFEGRMLAAAMSSIDRAAGPDIVRKHLREIVGAFEGDAPRQRGQGTANGPAVGTRRTINGQPAVWDGTGWLPEGGR